MSLFNMIDRGDDASERLFEKIKKENNVPGKEVTRISAAKTLKDTINGHSFMFRREIVYVPTLWEGCNAGSFTIDEAAQCATVTNQRRGILINFLFPFAGHQMIDILREKQPGSKLLNGDCTHRSIPEEQCGICMDCIEKFLCYKELGIETEDVFMEDPIDGHGARERLYQLLNRVVYPSQVWSLRATRQDIAIAALLNRGFFGGFIPASLAKVIERRFKPLLTMY